MISDLMIRFFFVGGEYITEKCVMCAASFLVCHRINLYMVFNIAYYCYVFYVLLDAFVFLFLAIHSFIRRTSLEILFFKIKHVIFNFFFLFKVDKEWNGIINFTCQKRNEWRRKYAVGVFQFNSFCSVAKIGRFERIT